MLSTTPTQGFPSGPEVGQLHFDFISGMWKFDGVEWVKPIKELPPKEKYWLFLDDLRQPEDVNWSTSSSASVFAKVRVARSTEEAQDIVNAFGLPQNITFDHDLGGEDTGFKFMWWLINGHLDNLWDLRDTPTIQIHTANTIGAEKLIALWTNFCRTQEMELNLHRVWPKEKNA